MLFSVGEMRSCWVEILSNRDEMPSDRAEMRSDGVEIPSGSGEMPSDGVEMSSDGVEMSSDWVEMAAGWGEMLVCYGRTGAGTSERDFPCGRPGSAAREAPRVLAGGSWWRARLGLTRQLLRVSQ